ncbi:uncharacterized protein LOC115684892 [Syzygium oleosum]|uniref:uncharacterized protein LOC115684892 n=1 Tax=Syzygium oleosum TaxID=219896 RepID=UPI0011D23F29|nr:uncharacterized protein LOC115684892 [Syzygium oleosum]
MSKNRVFLMILLLVWIPCGQSWASLVRERGRPSRLLLEEETKANESSPAPSPGLSSGSKKPDAGSSTDPTVASGGEGKCSIPDETCQAGENLTACLQHPENASKGTFVLVQYDAEDPLKVEILCLPAKSSREVQLRKQQHEVVNFTDDVGVCSSLMLKAGDVTCSILVGVPVSAGNFFQQFPYATRVAPIHGLYLLLGLVITIGGVWACCKFGKPERRVDGIPYQELEMGQADSTSANVVEAAEGWDESWDDDWGDEIREVKSPSQGPEGNAAAKANGFPSRSSNRIGWEDNWND